MYHMNLPCPTWALRGLMSGGLRSATVLLPSAHSQQSTVRCFPEITAVLIHETLNSSWNSTAKCQDTSIVVFHTWQES